MNRIFCLMGKSASGKDTVYKKLIKEISNLNGYVSYTTRPKRDYEKDNVDYNFVTKEYLLNTIENDSMIEYRCYHADDLGTLYYATILDYQFDTNNDILIIGTVDTLIKLRAKFGEEIVIPIYIYTNDKTRLLRSMNRVKNPNYHEICRRFVSDDEEFSEERLNTYYILNRFKNNNLNNCVKNIKMFIENIQGDYE